MTPFDPIPPDADLDRPGCEAGRAALQRMLDGDAAWDTPEADAHRTICADCREELALARGSSGYQPRWSLRPGEPRSKPP